MTPISKVAMKVETPINTDRSPMPYTRPTTAGATKATIAVLMTPMITES